MRTLSMLIVTYLIENLGEFEFIFKTISDYEPGDQMGSFDAKNPPAKISCLGTFKQTSDHSIIWWIHVSCDTTIGKASFGKRLPNSFSVDFDVHLHLTRSYNNTTLWNWFFLLIHSVMIWTVMIPLSSMACYGRYITSRSTFFTCVHTVLFTDISPV